MFPEDIGVEAFWWSVAAAGAGYVGLFVLVERPVALRPERLAWSALAIVGVRLSLVPLGHPIASSLDFALACAAVLGAACLWLAGRVLVVRADTAVLREQILTSSQRLFLTCEEPNSNLFRLTAKEGTQELRIRAVTAKLHLITLPRLTGPGKIALLVHWLSKQYPGPVPRICIVLKKE